MYIKANLLFALFTIHTLPLIANDPLPDDELWELCTTFKKENLPRIKTLIERSNYDINAEVNCQWCGGVTILHATFWWYRWILDAKKREAVRPVLFDTLQLLLEHKANPHVMIPDCLVNDEVMPAQLQDSINSAYLHAKIASDQEVRDLMVKFVPVPQYPTLNIRMSHDSKYIWFENESANKEKMAQRRLLIQKAKIKHAALL